MYWIFGIFVIFSLFSMTLESFNSSSIPLTSKLRDYLKKIKSQGKLIKFAICGEVSAGKSKTMEYLAEMSHKVAVEPHGMWSKTLNVDISQLANSEIMEAYLNGNFLKCYFELAKKIFGSNVRSEKFHNSLELPYGLETYCKISKFDLYAGVEYRKFRHDIKNKKYTFEPGEFRNGGCDSVGCTIRLAIPIYNLRTNEIRYAKQNNQIVTYPVGHIVSNSGKFVLVFFNPLEAISSCNGLYHKRHEIFNMREHDTFSSRYANLLFQHRILISHKDFYYSDKNRIIQRGLWDQSLFLNAAEKNLDYYKKILQKDIIGVLNEANKKIAVINIVLRVGKSVVAGRHYMTEIHKKRTQDFIRQNVVLEHINNRYLIAYPNTCDIFNNQQHNPTIERFELARGINYIILTQLSSYANALTIDKLIRSIDKIQV